MRILSECSDTDFSCGVYQLTGFGDSAEGERLSKIREDLRDCDGRVHRYSVTRQKYNYVIDDYEAFVENDRSPCCAMIMVSLNARQCKFWRPILLEYDYVEVVKPIRNPNSGNTITIFIRQRKPKPRKKKEKKA